MTREVEHEQVARMSDARLMKEYQEMRKGSFDSIFGNNARERGNLCVAELRRRGITHEPNIFGDMEIEGWR